MLAEKPISQGLAPYGERNSTHVDKYAETIFGLPEVFLDEPERQEAFSLARGLMEGKWSELSCEASMDLEKLDQTSATESAQSFYLNYFKTEKGREDLTKLGIESDDAATITAVLDDIELVKSRVNVKERKQIAINSRLWYKDELAKRLEQDPSLDKEYQDIEPLHVNYNPSKLLDKMTQLQAYRRFYRQVRQQLEKQPATDLRNAQSVLLDIYAARVNSEVVVLYPSVINLTLQCQRISTDEKATQWNKRLAQLAPIIHRAAIKERHEEEDDFKGFTDRFARRLDFLRNGAAWQDDGTLSPVSTEVAVLAKELADTTNETMPDNPMRLSAELVSKLDTIYWDADKLKLFLEAVLRHWGMLSEYQSEWDEIEERDGFAPDGKWQEVIHPKKRSLSVRSNRRTQWIPGNYNRTLTQLYKTGVLPGSAHELVHLLQTDFDYKVGETIPLAKIKGRGTVALREMGAVSSEREMQNILGKDRPTNLHYLRALETKLRGANRMEVVRAYFNSRIAGQEMDGEQLAKAREASVDATLRLYRKKGYDSQPLDYIEQEIIRRELGRLSQGQAHALMICGTSFSLKDTAKLRKFGLIEIPKTVDANPAQDVLDVFLKEFLPQL